MESAGAMTCISASCASVSASGARACATRIFAAARFFSCDFDALSARSASVGETTLRRSNSCWRCASLWRNCNCASCASASWIAVSICAAARSRRARSSDASSCTITCPPCKRSPSHAKIFSTRPPERGPTCASSTSIVPETAFFRVSQPPNKSSNARAPAGPSERAQCLTDNARMFSSFWCKRTLENNSQDPGETFLRHHPEFFHLRRIHDGLNNRQQNLDDKVRGNVFSHHSRPLPGEEKISEILLKQCSPAALDDLKHLRRFLAHITHERRLNLIQFVLRAGQQLAQSRRKIVRLCARHFFQHRLHTLEFIGQHRLEQIDLARKMSIKCLFADPQFLRQIVHGHVAESVTEKVRPRRIHYSLSNRRVLSAYRSRFVPALHLVWFGSRGSRYSTTPDRLFYARIGAQLRHRLS